MRRPLERARILRRQDDQPTLPARVKRILRKYGATMLLPGPAGILQYNFQPGNYKESTGNTLAGIDQQVGLVVDAARSPGPELATAAAIGVSGGFVNNGDGSYSKPIGVEGTLSINGNAVPSGNYVIFRFDVVALSGNITPFVGGSSQPVITVTGTKEINAPSGLSTATEASIYCAAANSVTVRAISVRELPGTHAAQATSGFQPYLRQVPKTLGPEMWANDYSGFTLGTGWSISGNKLIGASVAVTQSAFKNVGLALGKSYVARYRISSLSAGTVRAIASSGVSGAVRSAVGDYEDVITPTTGSGNYGFIPFAAFTGEIEVLSIREVVEWTYAWQFDATDDRLVHTSVPFQTTDEYFRISAVCKNPDATLRRAWQIQDGTGELAVWLANGTCTFAATGAAYLTAPFFGELAVVTARRSAAGLRSLRVDGVFSGSSASVVTPFTATASVIGNRLAGDRQYAGPFYCDIAGKGAITDAELLVLEKFMARLQGRSL